jgi:hypothetical protein
MKPGINQKADAAATNRRELPWMPSAPNGAVAFINEEPSEAPSQLRLPTGDPADIIS